MNGYPDARILYRYFLFPAKSPGNRMGRHFLQDNCSQLSCKLSDFHDFPGLPLADFIRPRDVFVGQFLKFVAGLIEFVL